MCILKDKKNPLHDVKYWGGLFDIYFTFFSFGVLSRIARRKRNVEIKLFGKQAMMYDAILKQALRNYLIIAFINNQFLTSICLSTCFITSKDTAR